MYEAFDYGNDFGGYNNDYFYQQPNMPYQQQQQVMAAAAQAAFPYQAAFMPQNSNVVYDEPPKVYQVRRTLYQPPPQQQQQTQIYSLPPQIQTFYGNQPGLAAAMGGVGGAGGIAAPINNALINQSQLIGPSMQASQPVYYQTPQATTLPRIIQPQPTGTNQQQFGPQRIILPQQNMSNRAQYPTGRTTLPPVQMQLQPSRYSYY